jgi:subtilisin-like proprotein convertase family protein
VAAQITALTPGVTVITPTANYGTIAPGAGAVNATPFGFSIDGGVPCGTALSFMKVITSDQRVFTITFNLVAALPPAMSPVVNTYVSTDVPKPIPDANPNGVDSVVNVPGDFLVGKATASLTISHTYDSDLDISLVNPADTSVLLSSGNGGSGDNYVNTVFDDAAATPIVSGTAPFTSTYQPQEPLATFNSNAGGGQWKLHAVDTAGGDTGTIVTWTLKLVPAYCVYPVPNLKLANVTYADVGGTSNGNGFIEPGENSINVLAALQNVGITTATSISATLIPQTPGISMNVGALSYPNINVGATVTNSTPFNFAVSPSYACGLPIDFNLNESTARGNFAQSFTLPTGQGPAPANVFYDDVESGQGGWITGTTYSGWSWQITTEDSHSPTHSWTDSPGANYPVGGSTWLESPVFDFSAYDDVTLSFYHKYETEAGFDFGFVEVSIDGGATWLPDSLAAYDGVQSTWTQATVDLAPLAHQANARFRFRLFSDPGVVYDGWHIDDIQVSGMKRICNPVSSDWQKLVYVNGVLTTTSPINVKSGDVLQVVDRVNVTSTGSITFALTENWSPAFTLSSFVATAGSVVTTSSSVAWNGNNLAPNATHTLTKTFAIVPGYTTGTISESLVVENGLPLYPDRGLNFSMPGPSINTPASIANTQLPNQSAVKPLVISNTGQGQLNWNIFEFLPPALRQPAQLTAPQAITASFAEGFDDISTLVGNGWARINNSNPLGGSAWFQGNPGVFVSQSGATNSYIGANFNNTGAVGTISNWLLTPEVQLNNGTKITFWTRVPTGSPYPDRLEVRLSTSGGSIDVGTSETSVGVFTTTLLSINPNLDVDGYPDTWTVYTVTVSGLSAPTTGRFGLRYFVTDGGANGANSNYIGIDTFNFVTLPSPCQLPIDVPWMNVSPTSGSTPAGGSSTVSVTLNSTGLVAGAYNALVCIGSNDPANPTVQVPVTLNVIAHVYVYLPIMRKSP